ncbi:hypothetical protein CAPTEDRAFT_199697 [Capitella teleta]|uniref:Uncharacterized protein n=1 Tax=Capitella teleta TaxID=283909 RepID=R7VC39_CAPTE|nr:hypothetical protein CAPTEDRAFT_199697 [Capitella teleta]|eukprot:ELU13235.1 hypothetical protein CAPTEDRAFT_199697 [Capitella teleta]
MVHTSGRGGGVAGRGGGGGVAGRWGLAASSGCSWRRGGLPAQMIHGAGNEACPVRVRGKAQDLLHYELTDLANDRPVSPEVGGAGMFPLCLPPDKGAFESPLPGSMAWRGAERWALAPIDFCINGCDVIIPGEIVVQNKTKIRTCQALGGRDSREMMKNIMKRCL